MKPGCLASVTGKMELQFTEMRKTLREAKFVNGKMSKARLQTSYV